MLKKYKTKKMEIYTEAKKLTTSQLLIFPSSHPLKVSSSNFPSLSSSQLLIFVFILIVSCILYPNMTDACAWYGGAVATGNGGSAGGGGGCGKNVCCVGSGSPGSPGGTPPGNFFGSADNTASMVGNNVDVRSGNFMQSETDMHVSSPGISVRIGRHYNNLDSKITQMGSGWRFSYDMRVIFVSDNAGDITHAYILNPNGTRDMYTKGTGDTFDPPDYLIDASLIKNPDDTATLYMNNLTYSFNQGGRLTEIRDLNNNTLAINLADSSTTAEILSIVDSVGRTYNFTYENGKIKTVTDPVGRQAIYTYNGDLLTGAANPLNETTTYSYDPSTYDLLTITNNKSETYVTNTYDSFRRVATHLYGGRTYAFNYDNDGDGYEEILSGETLVTEQGQNTSTYYYNTTFGYVTKVIDPLNKETDYAWDIQTKQLLSITDPLGNVTSFDYYADGKLWTVTQTISASESKATTYEYYDSQYADKIKSITDPEGLKTTYTYSDDGKANLASIEDPYGNITYYETYNSNGQVTQIKDANGKYTDIAYDQYGYIDYVTDPLNRTTDYTHDSVGNRTQVEDALLRTTDYVYDNYSRLDYTTDHLGHVTDYDYDLNGNLKTVTDAQGHDTHYEYNEIGQLRFIKDHFNAVKTEYVYQDNKLWKVINARGGRIEYSYDALNRVETKTLYDDSETMEDQVIYTYDDAGRLLTIDNNAADITLGYDKVHRLTSVTTGGAMPAFTINYEYFKNDKRYTMTDAVGTTQYSLPARPQPTDPVTETIISPNMGTFAITYDNLMRRDDMTLGNGIVADYQYDDASQLTLLEYKDGATPVTSHQYPLYDAVGNRKTEIDINGTHDFNYDELYRLTSATHPTGNPNESFSYTDPVGSVGNRTSSHLSNAYTYDELNRLQSDDQYTYGYDADGNLISKEDKTTGEYTEFYHDAENKLVNIDIYDSNLKTTLLSSSSYAYDGFERRVKKDVDGVVTYFIYDHEDIRFETDDIGTITAEYVHGPGIDRPLALRRSGENYYYHVNGLGTVTALTDSSKAVVQEYVYDSFGQIISQTGNIQNSYTYTSREYDETGMYYYRERYYDAGVGRFISEDPIGYYDIINFYNYVGNNSINRIDPFGLWKLCIPFDTTEYENIGDPWLDAELRGIVYHGASAMCLWFLYEVQRQQRWIIHKEVCCGYSECLGFSCWINEIGKEPAGQRIIRKFLDFKMTPAVPFVGSRPDEPQSFCCVNPFTGKYECRMNKG